VHLGLVADREGNAQTRRNAGELLAFVEVARIERGEQARIGRSLNLQRVGVERVLEIAKAQCLVVIIVETETGTNDHAGPLEAILKETGPVDRVLGLVLPTFIV